MSSFISEERSAVKFMIGIIAFEFAMALIFGTGLPIAYYQHWQELLVRQEMGIAALQTLLHLTSHLYTLLFIQTGLAHAMTPLPPPTHQVADLSLTEKLSWAGPRGAGYSPYWPSFISPFFGCWFSAPGPSH
jgi:hypothetical protein